MQALGEGAAELEELELALNEVTADGLARLCQALVGKRRLARLVLRENELEDAGAALLARTVGSLPALRVLDLCQNQVRCC